MIPKIIHYCWFGRGELPDLAKNCIESWHRYMPDWEYRLWNEDNFDVHATPYTQEAYEARKYAFVSDYVRLWALYKYGGLYMDTDVEVLKPLDDLMHLPAFTGYEGSKHSPPVTGTMASERKGEWVKEQLDYYSDRHFLMKDGTYDMTTNTQTISSIMMSNGFECNGQYQIYEDLHIFPVDYFCPRLTTGEVMITNNTYCDHHFVGSWDGTGNHENMKSKLLSLFGNKFKTRLIKLKRILFD